jgi:hypothetical protein
MSNNKAGARAACFSKCAGSRCGEFNNTVIGSSGQRQNEGMS